MVWFDKRKGDIQKILVLEKIAYINLVVCINLVYVFIRVNMVIYCGMFGYFLKFVYNFHLL